MPEKQSLVPETQMGDAGAENQAYWCCDGVLRRKDVVSGCSRQQGKGSLEEESSSSSSELWHISLEKRNRLVICLTSSCTALHYLPLVSAILGLMACHCCFIFSGGWNPCTSSSCHWGLHQCHKHAAQKLYFIIFSRRLLLKKKINVKKHSVKTLPTVWN